MNLAKYYNFIFEKTPRNCWTEKYYQGVTTTEPVFATDDFDREVDIFSYRLLTNPDNHIYGYDHHNRKNNIVVHAQSITGPVILGKQNNIADKVLYGNIYTGTSESSTAVDAEAVAILGKRILAVGTKAQVAPYIGPNTEIVEYSDDQLIVPGLVDGHTHVNEIVTSVYNGTCLLTQLQEGETYEKWLEEIRTYVEANPNRKEWIFAGWEDAGFTEHGATNGPEYYMLDAIRNDRAIYAQSSDGHSCWINSYLMKAADIDPDLPAPADPTGGHIEVYPEGHAKAGKATGCFRDQAMININKARDVYDDEIYDQGMLLSGDWWNWEVGYTARFQARDNLYYDLSLAPFAEAAIRVAKDGRFDERAEGCLVIDDVDYKEALLKQGIGYRDESKDEIYKMNVIKFYMDGIIENLGALMMDKFLNPYTGDPLHYGTTRWGVADVTPEAIAATEAALRRLGHLIAGANKAGMNIHVHSMGDRAGKNILDAMEYAIAELNAEGLDGLNILKNARNCMVHLGLVRDEDKVRMANYGVIACFNPWCCKDPSYWTFQTAILGQERALKQYPMQSLIQAGCKFSFGTDLGASYVYDSVECFHVLTTRKYNTHAAETELSPEEKLTRKQAIDAMTKFAAYQMKLENEIGTIERGKDASFTVFSKNLLDSTTVPDDQLMSVKVDETIIRGKSVYSRVN